MDKNIIDQIKELLPSIISLTGIEKKGLHPVHKSPGNKEIFFVNPETNTWHCSLHQSSGHSIHYIALKEGSFACQDVSKRENFPAVLEIAAKYVGLTIGSDKNLLKEYYAKYRYLEIVQAAQNYFLNNMSNGVNDLLTHYWGFSAQDCTKLKLGYNIAESNGLLEYLKNIGYSETELVQTGLINYNKHSKEYSDFLLGNQSITIPFLNKRSEPLFILGHNFDFEDNYSSKTPNRLLVPDLTDNLSMRNDYHAKLYGLSTVWSMDPERIDALFVVNNIIDALTLTLCDIPVVCFLNPLGDNKLDNFLANIFKKGKYNIYCSFRDVSNDPGHMILFSWICNLPRDIFSRMFFLDFSSIPFEGSSINGVYKFTKKCESIQSLKNYALKIDELKSYVTLTAHPLCIDALLHDEIRVPRNDLTNSYFVIAKTLYHLMGAPWEETKTALNNFNNGSISSKTLEQVENQVKNLPPDQKDHSCNKLLQHPFIRKGCNPEKCPHKTADYPQELGLTADMEAIYNALLEIRMTRLSKEFDDKDFSYLLEFPRDLFPSPRDVDDSFVMTDRDFDNVSVFRRRFRAKFRKNFVIKGSPPIAARKWNDMVETWFTNMQTPYENEHAGTAIGLQEDFLHYLDHVKHFYYSFDLTDETEGPYRESIYFIEKENKVYVPTEIARKYMTEKGYSYKISQFRHYLKDLIVDNSFQKRIGSDTIRVWSIYYTAANFPILTKHYQSFKEAEQETLADKDLLDGVAHPTDKVLKN